MIARAHGHVRYPARFQLVAAMNPCRCGYANDPERTCGCPTGEPERYIRRVSGPFVDRVDVRVHMARVAGESLVAGPEPERSAVVASRIADARAVALPRNGGRSNAELPGSSVVAACQLDGLARRRLEELARAAALSARSIHRLLRVARTIADLEGEARVTERIVLAARLLRGAEEAALASFAA